LSLLVVTLTLPAAPAAAQDVAAAEELYNRGVTDYRAGRYEAACQEIGASARLDPLPGAIFTLAACEAHLGRVATAAAHYADFLQLVSRLPADQQAIQAERQRMAQAERAALLADIPYLTIWLADGSTGPVMVRRDGAPLETTLLGRELPVDPGEHVVTAESPDGGREEQRVTVTRREHKAVFVRLRPAASPAPGAATAGQAAASSGPPPLPSDSRSAPSTGNGLWPAIAAGVGIAGMAAGSVAGVLALNEKNIVDQSCQGSACTSARGKDAADTGKTEALASTVSFGLGIAGLATLVVLLLADGGSRSARAPVAARVVALSARALLGGASF
jgi:hypothetical protein